ncbi:sensor domain-containing diguanylate cyclase [Oscillospiraceae bacterium PP1C4]
MSDLQPRDNFKIEQDTLFYHAFMNASVGLLIVNEEMHIISANDYMCKYFGISPDGTVDLTFIDLFQCHKLTTGHTVCGNLKKCKECYIRNGLIKLLTNRVSVENISISHTFVQNDIEVTRWFLVSGNPIILNNKLYAVVCFQDFTPYKQQELLLLERLELDLATDTLNKHSLLKFIQDLATEKTQSFVICMTDFDDFKKINDQYGHTVGDSVLKAFSRISRKNIRSSDILGRYGGEEFVFIFLETSLDQATKVICRIQKELKELFASALSRPVTFSAGLTHIDMETCGTPRCTLLIDQADELLYKAKKRGKNRIVTIDNEFPFE